MKICSTLLIIGIIAVNINCKKTSVEKRKVDLPANSHSQDNITESPQSLYLLDQTSPLATAIDLFFIDAEKAGLEEQKKIDLLIKLLKKHDLLDYIDIKDPEYNGLNLARTSELLFNVDEILDVDPPPYKALIGNWGPQLSQGTTNASQSSEMKLVFGALRHTIDPGNKRGVRFETLNESETQLNNVKNDVYKYLADFDADKKSKVLVLQSSIRTKKSGHAITMTIEKVIDLQGRRGYRVNIFEPNNYPKKYLDESQFFKETLKSIGVYSHERHHGFKLETKKAQITNHKGNCGLIATSTVVEYLYSRENVDQDALKKLVSGNRSEAELRDKFSKIFHETQTTISTLRFNQLSEAYTHLLRQQFKKYKLYVGSTTRLPNLDEGLFQNVQAIVKNMDKMLHELENPELMLKNFLSFSNDYVLLYTSQNDINRFMKNYEAMQGQIKEFRSLRDKLAMFSEENKPKLLVAGGTTESPIKTPEFKNPTPSKGGNSFFGPGVAIATVGFIVAGLVAYGVHNELMLSADTPSFAEKFDKLFEKVALEYMTYNNFVGILYLASMGLPIDELQ